VEALCIVHVELKAEGGPPRSHLKITVRYVFVSSMAEEVTDNEKCCDFPIIFSIKWVQLLLMYGFS